MPVKYNARSGGEYPPLRALYFTGITCSDLERKRFENEWEQFDTAFIPHDFVAGSARNRARFRKVRFQNRTELAGISWPRRPRGRGRLSDARRLERGRGGGQALWRAMAR